MQLCCDSGYCGSTGNFISRIHELAETGFTHYSWSHQWNTDFIYTAPEWDEIRKVQKSAGIKLLDIHGSCGQEKCWTSTTEYIRKAGVELIKNRIEMLDALEGEGVIVMHAPRLHYFLEGFTPLDQFERANKEARIAFEPVCRSLDELMPELEKHNRKIAIENLNLDDFSFIDAYLSRYPEECLGICYDCGHANVFCDRMDQIEKRKSRLVATHLHDNDGTMDQHRPVFMGNINFERLAGIIAESSYKNPPCFEITMRHTPFMDLNKELLEQTEEARRAFLADAYERCVRFAKMVNDKRSADFLPSGRYH